MSAVTAVGAAVEQTCASVRAGICRFGDHAYYRTLAKNPEWEDEEPLVVAAVPGIDPLLDGPARLHALLVPALADLVERAGLRRRDIGECALLVALPAPDAAVAGWGLADTFLADLRRRTGLAFKVERARQSGHSAMIELLDDAAALLAEGAATSCILAGVDSYLSEDRIALLDGAYRLKSARNVDGFIPGEAATALLLESPLGPGARERGLRATIEAVGLGVEPATILGDRQSSGVGLTAALRAAAAAGCGSVHCDLNGESYRAFEWSVARARLGKLLAGAEVVHPARNLGDVGAATGGLLAALAARGFERAYAPPGDAVIWASSQGELRAAARIARA
jgi:3-oxoacyl-[acyl-carrier-protein] synthase-1